MKRILPFFLICITVLSLGNEVQARSIFQEGSSGQADAETGKRTDPVGYPVLGAMQDTLFQICSRSGSLTPKDRASRISSRIQVLAENDLYRSDSLKVEELEGTY